MSATKIATILAAAEEDLAEAVAMLDRSALTREQSLRDPIPNRTDKR